MFKITESVQRFAHRAGLAALCALSISALPACSDSDDDDDSNASGDTDLSFFVTSTTQDGNLGGLTGADQICDTLATAVGAGAKTWHAYLSAMNNGTPINARERIGSGPWYNADGVMVAANLATLHAMTGNAAVLITERGTTINGQWNGSNGMNGAPVNEHDIITGSDPAGNLIVSDTQSTCADWTDNTMTPGPQVGHTDGMGPNMDTSMERYTSWNGGHATPGCSAAALAMTGSTGRLYCFATN
jgi:hypothetical protein